MPLLFVVAERGKDQLRGGKYLQHRFDEWLCPTLRTLYKPLKCLKQPTL